MSHTHDEQVLLKTRFGSVDGGTCTVAPGSEGALWDRLASGLLVSMTAEISLTTSRIKVVRMFGSPYDIPLDAIMAVQACSSTGGRYWGRNSVLKVLWEKEGSQSCTWLMLGPGRDVAAEWQNVINGLLDRHSTRPCTSVMEHEKDTRA